MIVINYRDSRPIYEQVRDGIRKLIIGGVIADGEKLPSVRTLAAQLAINPNTIMRAYSELEAGGYICTVPGKGAFAVRAEAAVEQARRAQLLSRAREIIEELRYLGVTEEELSTLLKGESE